MRAEQSALRTTGTPPTVRAATAKAETVVERAAVSVARAADAITREQDPEAEKNTYTHI